MVDFLKKYPSEYLLVRIKNEDKKLTPFQKERFR